MPEKYQLSIARIFAGTSAKPVGAGLFVGSNQVITCAHVVNTALGLSKDEQEQPPKETKIKLDFPFAAPNNWLLAYVFKWEAINSSKGGDLAFLELESRPPHGTRKAKFYHIESYLDNPFRAFGFPKKYDPSGQPVLGIIGESDVRGRVFLMKRGLEIPFLDEGFSGTGVWDMKNKQFVGIIVEVEAGKNNPSAIGVMIPAKKLNDFMGIVSNSDPIKKSKATISLIQKRKNMSAITQATPPRKIGRYELKELIGEGSFGEVYKASDPDLNRFVALKRLKLPEGKSLDIWQQNFKIEAQIVASFDHPHIIEIYDFGIEDDYPYLVMEFLEGGSLAKRLAKQPLTHEEALSILIPLCKALSYAHQRGIVHQDIKPGNVMFDRNGEIKLLDFGLAQKEVFLEPKAFYGSLDYASPEQVLETKVGFQTDVYSLGVVLFETIYGKNPQLAENVTTQIRLITSQDIFVPNRSGDTDIPYELVKVINKCLQKDLSLRYQNCQELLPELIACLEPPKEFAEPETPTGAVPINSYFYIERKADQQLLNQFLKPGTITTIRAGRQTGKTSLLLRGIGQAKSAQIPAVKIDFQQLQAQQLESLENLLQYVAFEITLQTNMDISIFEDFWKLSFPLTTKFNRFLKSKILSQMDHAILLAIDEADRLSEFSYRKDFFALLRSWNTEQAIDEDWQKLKLVLVISTHPTLLIDNTNQSPFNVGLTIHLDDFDFEQVAELNHKHGRPIREIQIEPLMALFGGHPYLIRQAFYTLVTREWSLDDLRRNTLGHQSPFEQHLRFYRDALRENPPLEKAFLQILKTKKCPDEKIVERLISVGLVKRSGDYCEPRCKLYAAYFGKEKL